MKATISKPDLLRALGPAREVADRKSTLPILGSVLLTSNGGSLHVTATDMVIAVRTDVAANVTGQGGCAVDARHLYEIVKAAPSDDISLAVLENNRVEVRSGKAKYALVGLPVKDFPKLAEPDAGFAWQELPAKTLAQCIDATIFSASTDDTRYHLNGILFECNGSPLRMVATDGHRLAKIERGTCPILTPGVIIPRKGAQAISRLLGDIDGDCGLAIVRTHLFVKAGATVVSVKLVEAQFPPYEQVIPKSVKRTVNLDRAQLLAAIQRVSILSPEKTDSVRFAFGEKALTLSSDSPECGSASEEVDADLAGAPVTASFNARYVVELLAHVAGDELTIELGDELDPCVLRGTADVGYLGVVMPMRT